MLLRRSVALAVGVACWQIVSLAALAQSYRQPSRSYGPGRRPTVARRPFDRGGSLSRNQFPARNTDAVINEVITPIPLTEARLEAAKNGVDRQIRDLVEDLRPQMRQFFPDKLEALSGTSGWTPEARTALTKALRSGDPEQIYEAWLEAEPNNTTGAELIAREAALQRTFKRLEQSAEEGEATNSQLADVQDALDKLAVSNQEAGDLTGALKELDTWVQIQDILDEAEPDTGAAKTLPTGRSKIIKNPNLAFGTAVVLNETTVMVGSRGRGGVEVTRGNAADALGLPVINDDPLPDAEGAPQRSGTIIFNPRRHGETVRYLLNGEEFVMRPGTSQRLRSAQRYTIQYDRGGNEGMARYALRPGTFTWSPTEHGWQLYQQRYDVAIDNSRNPRDFHFVFDGEPMVVRAGHSRKISSLYPIMVEYDRGNNTEMVSKAINYSGNVEVGVNAEDNLLDLFPEQGNAKHPEEAELFH